MGQCVIEIEHVSKSFKGMQVLNDVNMTWWKHIWDSRL